MAILENIDSDKEILQNIDIDEISYRLGFGISNTPNHNRQKKKKKLLKLFQKSPMTITDKCSGLERKTFFQVGQKNLTE